MSEPQNMEIHESLQPRSEDVPYDLDKALSSVVSVRAKVPDDAFTAAILGTERAGNGVLIDDSGLIVTIGYLITEAETVWLMGEGGQACPGHVVAYDQQSGFGLVQALEPLRLPSLAIGSSSALRVGERVVFAGFGGRPHATRGGGALIDSHGRLAGIGSLFVQLPRAGEGPIDGNMVVPIDLLPPILDDLLKFGKTTTPPRPWLGMYTAESEDQLVIVGLAEDGPADQAGIEVGDRVIEVNGEPVSSLTDMFRRIWALGPAGVRVPLAVVRDDGMMMIEVESIDRNSVLKKPQLH
jgi:S1-C subfamily serine protease